MRDLMWRPDFSIIIAQLALVLIEARRSPRDPALTAPPLSSISSRMTS